MSGHTQPPPDGQPLLLHSLGQPLHGVDDGAAAADPHHSRLGSNVIVHSGGSSKSFSGLQVRVLTSFSSLYRVKK